MLARTIYLYSAGAFYRKIGAILVLMAEGEPPAWARKRAGNDKMNALGFFQQFEEEFVLFWAGVRQVTQEV